MAAMKGQKWMEVYSREAESTLVILSEAPEAVAGEIAALTSIRDYRLLPQDPMMIHDFYLGISGNTQGRPGPALRIREVGATHLITLKGQIRPTDWGGIERLEIELPWSRDALDIVSRKLIDMGLQMPEQRPDFDPNYPLSFMANLGLQVVQDRETHRQVRDIVPDGECIALAEMAIDSVVYHFTGQDIRHYEVEIEAKEEANPEAIKAMIEGLIEIFGPAVRRWNCGKLTTGNAVENMLSKGILEGLIDSKNNLKPVAYKLIAYYIRRGSRSVIRDP
jgi:inorganic triphosphatase YgiF